MVSVKVIAVSRRIAIRNAVSCFPYGARLKRTTPKAIPEDHRIKLLAQGKDVHIGEFGNEGSGGQSYLKYPWKAGQTYRVITRVHPDGKGNTAYYAWFFAPEEGEWRLIAGFLRPQTKRMVHRSTFFP